MGKIVYVSFYLFLLFFVFFVIDTEWKLEKTYKTSWGIPVYKYTFLSTKSYTLRALNSVFWGVRRGCVGCTYHNASKFFFNRYLYNKNYMHTYYNSMKLFSKMLRFGDFILGIMIKDIETKVFNWSPSLFRASSLQRPCVTNEIPVSMALAYGLSNGDIFYRNFPIFISSYVLTFWGRVLCSNCNPLNLALPSYLSTF